MSDGKLAANWVQQDVLRTLNEQQTAIEQFPLRPRQLAELIETVRKGRLTTSRAREVFAAMLAGGKSLDETMQSMGIAAVDESELENLCRELLAANPKVVAEVKEGKPKGLGQLIGQAKKKNPNVNPNRFRELCEELSEKDRYEILIPYRILIEKEPEDEGYYAYGPTLPGCFSNGRTEEEARNNIRDAVRLHLASLQARDTK